MAEFFAGVSQDFGWDFAGSEAWVTIPRQGNRVGFWLYEQFRPEVPKARKDGALRGTQTTVHIYSSLFWCHDDVADLFKLPIQMDE